MGTPVAEGALTRREREILALLADGLTGVQIAEKLVLSPDTVRTHVRNAMTKLGASTRPQAVALAVGQSEIGDLAGVTPPPRDRGPAQTERSPALTMLLGHLVELWDVESGAIYLVAEDGLALRRAASNGTFARIPETVALGEGGLGRAALDGRTRVISEAVGGALVAVPITGAGRLRGLIVLAPRVSRPIGRREVLLINALAGTVGRILAEDRDVARRLVQAAESFRTAWIASTVAA